MNVSPKGRGQFRARRLWFCGGHFGLPRCPPERTHLGPYGRLEVSQPSGST